MKEFNGLDFMGYMFSFLDRLLAFKVKDLRCNSINSIDMPEVEKYRKGLVCQIIVRIVALLVAILFTVGLVYLHISNGGSIIRVESVFIYFMTIVFIRQLIISIKSLILNIKGKIIKAQYGVLTLKYYKLKKYDNNSIKNKRFNYVQVFFPEDNAFMSMIPCNSKEFKRVKMGDKVVVVSFDGRNIVVVPCIH